MGRSRRRDAVAALAALGAGAAAGRACLVHELPWWVVVALGGWLVAGALHARRAGRGDVPISRDGDDWFLCPAGAHGGRHDPLVLLPPRYRSGWLTSLAFRDATGATRHLDVWSDAVAPEDFSYLHLACLFDVERPPSRAGLRASLGYTARRLGNGLGLR